MFNTEVQLYSMLEPRYKYTRAFCTEEEILLASSFYKFVNKELMPYRHEMEGGWHHDEQLALKTLHRLYAKLVHLGVNKTNLPEKYGGLGLSSVMSQMISEELSRADAGLAGMASKIPWVVSFILAAKRDDLLEEFLPFITGDDAWTVCIAFTEPTGGANLEDPALDFRTLRTIARPEGDSYVINGHKLWPGSSGPAEHFQSPDLKGHLGYWTIATTDPAMGEDGVGIFYVPPDAPGLSFSKPYEKMGFAFADENTDIWFEDVRIQKKYRLDTKRGEGGNIMRGYLQGFGRLGSAASLTGLSQAVLEIVLECSKHRHIAGTPMRERSLFASMLGEMLRAIEVSRQYHLSVAWQTMHPEIYGEPWSKEMLAKFSIARSFAADTAEMVTNRAMELMGSLGYSYEAHVEKYMRDFKIAKMWLGGAQRDRLDIAQGLYGPFKWAGFEEWVAKQHLIEPSQSR